MDTAAYNHLLPSDVTFKSTLWFGRSRSFPIFSARWYGYRSLSAMTVLMVLALLFFIGSGVIATLSLADRGIFAAFVVVPFACLCLLGPGLAVWMRSKGAAPRKELIGLVLVLAIGGGASFAVQAELAQLLKISTPPKLASMYSGFDA
jgi:hypothetical protein